MIFLGKYIDNRMKEIVQFIVRAVERFGNAVFTGALASLMLVLIFWLSLLLHLAFVHTFLPIKTFSWPVYLGFSECSSGPGLCSNPTAIIALDSDAGYGLPDFNFYNSNNENLFLTPNHSKYGSEQPGASYFSAEKPYKNKKFNKRNNKKNRGGYNNYEQDDIFVGGGGDAISNSGAFEAADNSGNMKQNPDGMKKTQQNNGNFNNEKTCTKTKCKNGGDSSDDLKNNIFARGQGYSIVLELEMPDCEANRDLGMFQVEISVHDIHGRKVASAQRPVLLPYRSELQQLASNALKVPSLLINDRYSETHTLRVPLYDAYVDHPLDSAQYLKVEVHSRYAHISSCLVEVHAQFSGVRWLLHTCPVLCATVGTSVNMLAMIAGVVIFWLKRMEKKSQRPQPQSALTNRRATRSATSAPKGTTNATPSRVNNEKELCYADQEKYYNDEYGDGSKERSFTGNGFSGDEVEFLDGQKIEDVAGDTESESGGGTRKEVPHSRKPKREMPVEFLRERKIVLGKVMENIGDSAGKNTGVEGEQVLKDTTSDSVLMRKVSMEDDVKETTGKQMLEFGSTNLETLPEQLQRKLTILREDLDKEQVEVAPEFSVDRAEEKCSPFEAPVKVFEAQANEFKSQCKVFEDKTSEFESKVKEFENKPFQFEEGRGQEKEEEGKDEEEKKEEEENVDGKDLEDSDGKDEGRSSSSDITDEEFLLLSAKACHDVTTDSAAAVTDRSEKLTRLLDTKRADECLPSTD